MKLVIRSRSIVPTIPGVAQAEFDPAHLNVPFVLISSSIEEMFLRSTPPWVLFA
ncbi:MAG: hypothetical protein MZV65_01350 [Chromatiales bacterium]|nr:hypothetical protein [Chromatiales bacterium]